MRFFLTDKTVQTGHTPIRIETAAASMILIPILFLYQIFIFHNIKKTAAYIILYLTAMCFLVGFPSVTGIKIGWSYNFIPFLGNYSL